MSITISTTLGSVVLKENFGSYEAGIDLDGPYINKQYLAPSWGVSFACVNALRGTVFVTGGVGGVVTRVFPHRCPESPGLYCMDARIIPEAEQDNKDSGRPAFNLPIIQCRYSVPKYEVNTSDDPGGVDGFVNDASPGTPYTFAVQNIDFGSELIKVPGSAFHFSSPTLATDVPTVRTVGTAQMTFVKKYVPYLPFVNVTQYINKLNLGTFFGQPEGTIQFLGLHTRSEYLSDGTRSREIELRFKWREFDFNKFMRPDDATFDFLYDKNSNMMYRYMDLKPLLA